MRKIFLISTCLVFSFLLFSSCKEKSLQGSTWKTTMDGRAVTINFISNKSFTLSGSYGDSDTFAYVYKHPKITLSLEGISEGSLNEDKDIMTLKLVEEDYKTGQAYTREIIFIKQ
ncbi:MAG: hypothetical protein LBR45_03040 [Bacteroidales bacterium]|jgi:hypothetical protein|nr:hypothetical protein [Bacteroidales bacterium]